MAARAGAGEVMVAAVVKAGVEAETAVAAVETAAAAVAMVALRAEVVVAMVTVVEVMAAGEVAMVMAVVEIERVDGGEHLPVTRVAEAVEAAAEMLVELVLSRTELGRAMGIVSPVAALLTALHTVLSPQSRGRHQSMYHQSS